MLYSVSYILFSFAMTSSDNTNVVLAALDQQKRNFSFGENILWRSFGRSVIWLTGLVEIYNTSEDTEFIL